MTNPRRPDDVRLSTADLAAAGERASERAVEQTERDVTQAQHGHGNTVADVAVARPAANRMQAAASRRVTRLSSHARATEYTYARLALRSAYISAIFACISWNVPIGWSNCLRSCTYGSTRSRAAPIKPRGPPARTTRS